MILYNIVHNVFNFDLRRNSFYLGVVLDGHLGGSGGGGGGLCSSTSALPPTTQSGISEYTCCLVGLTLNLRTRKLLLRMRLCLISDTWEYPLQLWSPLPPPAPRPQAPRLSQCSPRSSAPLPSPLVEVARQCLLIGGSDDWFITVQ